MAKSKKPNKQRKQPPQSSKSGSKDKGGAAAVPQRTSGGASIGDKFKNFINNPFTRFFGIFLGLMILFYYVFYVNIYENFLEQYITHTNAVIGSTLINIFGYGTAVDGALIQGDFIMNVKRGCDAIEPIGLASAIILAYPTVIKNKLRGVLVGVGVLLLINLVRIVTLYMTGIHFPKFFEMMHLEVWQFIFIILAVLYSILWIRWDGKKIAQQKASKTL